MCRGPIPSRVLWSQMGASAIEGQFAWARLGILPVIQTPWSMWKALHPETTVLSTSTGYSRNYSLDVYQQQGYTWNSAIYFNQTAPIDSRYHPKLWVLGLLGENTTKAYPYSTLGERTVINDTFEGQDVVVVFDRRVWLAVAFSRSVEGRRLTFEFVE